MTPDQAIEFATLMRTEYFSKMSAAAECSDTECMESDCETHNPITNEDVICNRCGEHAEMREHTGTECCGVGSRF